MAIEWGGLTEIGQVLVDAAVAGASDWIYDAVGIDQGQAPVPVGTSGPPVTIDQEAAPMSNGASDLVNIGTNIVRQLIPTRPGMPHIPRDPRTGLPVRGVMWDPVAGKWVKRRRRRRRLLTPTDLGDLAQLQALVGKGEVMKVAVMKAIK